LGDKIAWSGENTLCIWDSNTGKLLVVGLIENLDISASSGVVVRGF